jgi:uncharacterized protein YndB with AHSA1/START domain
MTAIEKPIITVETSINATVNKVWNLWTEPKHIIHWNNASEEWHTPRAENDLRTGGKFMSRMEAKDHSVGFDFTGEYGNIEPLRRIEYTIADGRKVQISFASDRNTTTLTESFEAEDTNPPELQKQGWQAILDNFKKYAETQFGEERTNC